MQTSQPTENQITPEDVVRELNRFVGCNVRLRFVHGGVETTNEQLILERVVLDEMAFFEEHAYALHFDDPDTAVTVDCAKVESMKWSFLVRPSLTLVVDGGRLVLVDLTDSGRVRAIEHSAGLALADEASFTQRSWRLGSCLRTVDQTLSELESDESRSRLEGLRQFLAPYESVARPPLPPIDDELPF